MIQSALLKVTNGVLAIGVGMTDECHWSSPLGANLLLYLGKGNQGRV
jgi:hypothetical protein